MFCTSVLMGVVLTLFSGTATSYHSTHNLLVLSAKSETTSHTTSRLQHYHDPPTLCANIRLGLKQSGLFQQTAWYYITFKHYLQIESFSGGKRKYSSESTTSRDVITLRHERNKKKKAFPFTFLKIWPPYYTVLTPIIICVTRKYSKLQEMHSNMLEAEFKEKICALK